MKTRTRLSSKAVRSKFRKGSYVKKDNRTISLHRGGFRIV